MNKALLADKRNWLSLPETFFLHIIVMLLILDISGTTSISTQYLLFAVAVILSFTLIKSHKSFYQIVILAILWFIINLSASLIFGRSLMLPIVLRYAANYILLPYLLLSYYKKNILFLLEKYILALTFISLPLYILNNLFVKQFDKLTDFFADLTSLNLIENPDYWSAGIYVNAISQSYEGISLLRNSGFMWEPGYFAVIIIFGLGLRWLKNGIRFDKAFFIYTIALLTTFSTSGYFAILILISSKFLEKLSLARVIAFLLLIIVSFNFVYSMAFMGGKIDLYIEAVDNKEFNYEKEYEAVKLNRVQIALYDIKRVARYPFGFGLNDRISFEGVNVVGTNGLTGLMRMWGVHIFIYFILALYKYQKIFNYANIKTKELLFLFIALLVVFFSQSIQYNILTYFLIISTIVFKSDLKVSSRRN